MLASGIFAFIYIQQSQIPLLFVRDSLWIWQIQIVDSTNLADLCADWLAVGKNILFSLYNWSCCVWWKRSGDKDWQISWCIGFSVSQRKEFEMLGGCGSGSTNICLLEVIKSLLWGWRSRSWEWNGNFNGRNAGCKHYCLQLLDSSRIWWKFVQK